MDDRVLEQFYQERLEERLIACIAKKNDLSVEKAMDIYYGSRLAEKIHKGTGGVQYLDYKVLSDILSDTEPELFVMEE
ncbi:MAG: hypothetical protein E7317_07290 [Clostridiales bacterium]|nr:hypothetical protein [Clostridiales bacterium]